MLELEFFGAAQTVTGSMHLLHTPRGPFALDCGLFQGRRKWAREMNCSFPLPLKKLRGVLLSHAHIDHSGKIPQLFRNGFKGPIHATEATCDLCDVMLADAAHIQEEDARYWNERRAKRPEDRIEPLYTVEDARRARDHFRGVRYNEPLAFAEDCTATWLEAGHILGSACILVEIRRRRPVRLLYTGDLGRFHMPILRDPTCPLPEADYLIVESTYSRRTHEDVGRMKGELVEIITETRARGGKVIIPAFSVGRTQHLVYWLSMAIADGSLDALPIFVDSPLSTHVTAIFAKHPECYDRQAQDFWHQQGDVFGRGLVRYITDVQESKALNGLDKPCVIISASGMCEAGRILHHLKNNVEDPKNTVIIVGYQARHTLGRRIVEGIETLKIFGRKYRLKARVEVLNGFSAHADRDDFLRLLGPLAPKLKAAFAVHGENGQLAGMAELLREVGCRRVETPEMGDRFRLS
jgi:metallo-beta-lactamase family protein